MYVRCVLCPLRVWGGARAALHVQLRISAAGHAVQGPQGGRRAAPRLWPEVDIQKAFLMRIIHSANIDTDKGGTPAL